jgi:hypothetical protein
VVAKLNPDELIAAAAKGARTLAPSAALDPLDPTLEPSAVDPLLVEALEVATSSLNTEAALNDLGVATMSRILRRSVTQRLLVDSLHHNVVEIAAVTPTVVNICGLPRTGTTALHFLFAQDPNIRVPRAWEATQPVPAPDRALPADPRIARTEQVFAAIDEYMPEFAAMHVQTADGPVETLDLLMLSLRTHNLTGLARVPSYLEWFHTTDRRPAYEAVRRALQVLQWKWPPSTWVIKSPSCTSMLDSIEAALPGTRHIWCHRDPAAAIPSVCSLIEHSRAPNTDTVDCLDLGAEVLDYFDDALTRAMAFRDAVGDDRFVDLTMDEFVADPVGATQRAGAAAGLPLSETGRDAMTYWVGHQKRPARGHRYTAARYGLDANHIRTRLAPYLERFPVRLEDPQ